MKTIQVLNENGKLAGTMSVDCKPTKKVNKPYFNESFELVIPAGWSEKQLKMWLKSDAGKMAVEANKVAKQAAKQAQCEVSEVSPVILTIITMKKEITPTTMKTSIKLSDFRFQFTAYGLYKVTYTSPKTGKIWTALTNNMPLIDATKNADNPKKVDLNELKNVCKMRS